MSAPFVSREPYDAAHPRALALYCSDGRFTSAVEELLRTLGHDRLDTLTLPGGPALLVSTIAQVAEHQAVRKASAFLIRGHALTHAVLLAHEGCGFYRNRMPRDAADVIARRQVTDLRAAAAELLREHKSLDVRLYFASVAGERVTFTAVS